MDTRYKYKVWNINKVIGTASYDAYNTGIDIVFESEKSSTGTISCTYSYATASSTAGSPNEVCTGSNGDYYTHPAFTFGNDEVRGIWIGKFEVSSETPSANYGGGDDTSLTVRILPNVVSWRYNYISNFSSVIQNMQIESNIYGLNTSRTNTDSHMLTNYEWGAVAYLTNSNYGRCTNGSCTKVATNNCISCITGIGDIVGSSQSSTACTTNANKYNGTRGVLASTTENITGVYDMSGGANEYVNGNMSSETGSYIFYPTNSKFASDWYNDNTAKYITTYAYGTSADDQTAYNRSRLGDAIGEVVLTSSSWYETTNIAYIVNSSKAWFIRGCNYTTSVKCSVFYTTTLSSSGVIAYNLLSTRAALVSLSTN